jgi:hypothetical protein
VSVPPGRLVLGALPDPVLRTVAHFEQAFGAVVRLKLIAGEPGAADEVLYASTGFSGPDGEPASHDTITHGGGDVSVEVVRADGATPSAVCQALTPALELAFESSREIEFFTSELSERFEEINLLYSISETLGSTLDMDSGARKILGEVRDVMGAKRGSLWVHRMEDDSLHLAAQVGTDGRVEPFRKSFTAVHLAAAQSPGCEGAQRGGLYPYEPEPLPGRIDRF